MPPTDSRHDSPLTEADLHAYADGALGGPRAAQVARYLGDAPSEARRIGFYARLNGLMQQTFAQSGEASGSADGAYSGHAGSSGSSNSSGSSGFGQANGGARTSDGGGQRRSARRAKFIVMALILVLVCASGWMAAMQITNQALNNAAVMALGETANVRWSAATPTLEGSASANAPDLGAAGLRLVVLRPMTLNMVARVEGYIYLNAQQQPVVLVSAMSPLALRHTQWMAYRIGPVRLLAWSGAGHRYVLAGDARTHGLMLAADAMGPK